MIPLFKAFRSTVTPPNERVLGPFDRLLVDPATGAPVGILNQSANGPDARFTPVNLSAAQIASPTAAMLADLDAVYRLDSAPYTRYTSNGTSLVAFGTAARGLSAMIRAPLPADLISIVNAVTPTNVALTLASQPVHARKLQVRIVIDTTHAITAGTLTLVGVDQDGNALSEVISLITAASVTIKSTMAFATVTSATVAAIAITGGAGSTTVGIGVSNDFGLPTGIGTVSGFALNKATKITTDFGGGTVVALDDVASTAVVDAVARTVAPTTAPSASGLIDYQFLYSASVAG